MVLARYRIVIFDLDGTLTPFRSGSCGEFSHTLLPGVAERVWELQSQAVFVGIASNQSAKRSVEAIHEQMAWVVKTLDLDPQLVDWTTDKAVQKPAPDMLLGLLALTGLQPWEALFVGDQATDEEAARRAGMDFIYASDYFGWGSG